MGLSSQHAQGLAEAYLAICGHRSTKLGILVCRQADCRRGSVKVEIQLNTPRAPVRNRQRDSHIIHATIPTHLVQLSVQLISPVCTRIRAVKR